MTNELDIINDSSLNVLPPARPVATQAIAVLRAHAEMMDMAFDLATKMVRTQLVPLRYRNKPEDATAAILYGAELGLNPIQCLQRVISIQGTPTLEARTMVALLQARGFGFRVFEQSDQVVEVWAWEPNSPKVFGNDPDDQANYRKRVHPDATSRWTIERAIKEGYVPRPSSDKSLRRPDVDDDWVTITKTFDGKTKKSVVGNMKYITGPQTMLKAKAQAEVCRDMAPDVLLGMPYSREDLESERRPDDEVVRPVRVAAEPITVAEIVDDTDTASPVSLVDKIKTAPSGDAQAEQPQETTETGHTDQAPETAETTHADAMHPSDGGRRKWMIRLGQLLTDAECGELADQLVVVAELAETAPLLRLDTVNDKQLRMVVNQLNAWQKTGELDTKITDILNRATAVSTDQD